MFGQVILKAYETFFKICINHKKQNCFNELLNCAISYFEKIQLTIHGDNYKFHTHLYCIDNNNKICFNYLSFHVK